MLIFSHEKWYTSQSNEQHESVSPVTGLRFFVALFDLRNGVMKVKASAMTTARNIWNTMGNSVRSTLLALFRDVLIFVPASLILAAISGSRLYELVQSRVTASKTYGESEDSECGAS